MKPIKEVLTEATRSIVRQIGGYVFFWENRNTSFPGTYTMRWIGYIGNDRRGQISLERLITRIEAETIDTHEYLVEHFINAYNELLKKQESDG